MHEALNNMLLAYVIQMSPIMGVPQFTYCGGKTTAGRLIPFLLAPQAYTAWFHPTVS